MKAVLLRNVKKGEYFTLTNKVKFEDDSPFNEVKSKYVYVKGEYDKSIKKYEIYKFDDICNYRYVKGDRIVYVDFSF